MRIAAAEISYASAHMAQTQIQRRLELTVTRPVAPAAPADMVSISAEAQAGVAEPTAGDEQALPPRLALLKDLLERVLGHPIKLGHGLHLGHKGDAAAPPQPARPRQSTAEPSLDISYSEHHEELEHLQVKAEGWVETADGQRISFKLSLALERHFVRDLELNVRTGEMAPRKKDPLVINFNGTAAELGSGRFDFDLDQDGQLDAVPVLGAGSSFLVLDRNGDGHINDGGELFGARSGDGFAELAALDADNNGWIDENDAAYQSLGVWRPDASGDGTVVSLAEADVGAIALRRIASAYEYRDGDNTPVASLRQTGVYLRDSGGAGTVQQLDFFV